jgi:hypothetical protein
MTDFLLVPSPYDGDGGHLIGRDPRTLTAEEFTSYLPDAPVGLAAIRAKCIDCAGGSAAEVRKCVATACPLWPLRMGVKPRGMREARGEKLDSNRGAGLAKWRAAQADQEAAE